jgi:hypothetical protein
VRVVVPPGEPAQALDYPALLGPREVAASARRLRQLDLDEAAFRKSRALTIRVLGKGDPLTRAEMYAGLARAGVSPAGQRGIHILARLAQEGLICFGPYRDKQPTFTLLDAWVPAGPSLAREEALARLAERHFRSHGPATAHDFAWWSGLSMADVRAGLAGAAPRLTSEAMGGVTHWFSPELRPARSGRPRMHLLPPYDEYLVAYRDRRAVLATLPRAKAEAAERVRLGPVIVADGAVIGTWKRRREKNRDLVVPRFFVRLGTGERQALDEAVDRYRLFLGRPVQLAPR